MSTRSTPPAPFEGFTDDDVSRVFAAQERVFEVDLDTGAARALVAARLGGFPVAAGAATDGLERGGERARRSSHDVSARKSGGRFIRRPVSRILWYAAAGLIIGATGVLIGRQTMGARAGTASRGAVATYTTAKGQRATITLPDGSTAALNVASRLDVPTDYLAGNRTIRLSGEAFFTVSHHDGTPFNVVAGAATTRVLGTSFVVRHYPTDSTTTVAVRDGKVAVRSVVVTAMRQAEVASTGTVQLGPVDPARFGFVRGVLTLNSVPLPRAIPELDRWYDADVRLGSPALAKREVTGGFTAGSLADLAAILELTFDVRVVRDGRSLTLYQR